MARTTSARCWVMVLATLAAGCGGDSTTTLAPTEVSAPSLRSTNDVCASTAGVAWTYDATKAGATFTDPAGKGLTYAVSFAPNANGLTATAGLVTGTPASPGVITATITATDALGRSVSDRFSIVTFAPGLAFPVLPATSDKYSDATSPLPGHFSAQGPGGSVVATDNMLATNPTTDAGATLGRVLFYDTRLSANDKHACSSCHIQSLGFGDTAALSRGFAGGLTTRHSMGLANARFYSRGHFFWDERANTLEDQVLQPIQNSVEMGMTLDALTTKLAATTFYRPLFSSAFGTPDITSDRVSKALAQYVRSLVSGTSKFDRAFTGGPPNFAGVFTAQEQQGQGIFQAAGCARCHGTNAQVSDDIHNTGLDATVTDVGAGQGRFKAPSLRNVALRGHFMHDGRFTSLAQVVDFYNANVQPNPNLDQRLRAPGGAPLRLGLSQTERNALVAFLGTLTDSTMIAAAKFSTPFK